MKHSKHPPPELSCAWPPRSDQDLDRAGEAQGERKNVTVLFADISGFTSFVENFDPEEAVGIVNHWFGMVAGIVCRYGGTIDKYIGDCVMALFGAPVVHENDPEQAVRAALEIMDTLQELRRVSSFPLSIHIGVNAGLAVAGKIGTEHRMQYTVMGDVVNVASRLQHEAQPGQVLVGETVYQLTHELIEYADGGTVALKGKGEPVKAYVALQARPRQARFQRACQRGLTPFVGRDTELPALRSLFMKAVRGFGQAVEIRGEPGSGKSRLLYEFIQSLEPGHLYLEGRCPQHGGASAYQPIIEILRQFWGLPERITTEVQEKVGQQLEELQEYRSSFEELLSLPVSDPQYAQTTPQVRRRRTFEGLIALFEHAARARPVILAIGDVHWIDPTSCDFISTLLDAVASHRILLVLLSRPEFDAPWKEHTALSTLSLPPLGGSEARRLVHALFDGPVAPELESFILRRTGGNPFFVEELTRALREAQVVKRNGCYALSLPPEQLNLPATVQGVLAARMDGLGEDKHVLQVASVIGQEFSIPVLRRVLGANERLEEQLGFLSGAEFVYPTVADTLTYAFKHGLTRDVAYETLLRATRRQLHRQVGDAIRELLPDTAAMQPEILGHHYAQAGLAGQAVPYWRRAGERAVERSAHVEAITHLSRGLALLKELPEAPERTDQELALQVALGVPLISTKGYTAPEAERAYARARDLCRQVGDTPQLSPVLRGLWGFYHHRGEYRTARELGEQLVNWAQRTADPALLMEAHRVLGITLCGLGDLPAARMHLEQGLALYDSVQHRAHAFLYGQDAGVASASQAALALWLLGYPDQALERSRSALSLARNVAHPFSLAGALFCGALLHQLRREGSAAQAQAEAAISISAEHGFPFFSTQATTLRGWALAEQGQRGQGIAQMREGIAAYRATGGVFLLPHYLALLAEAQGEAGAVEEGLTVLTEATALVDTHGERRWEAELYQLRGELLLKQGLVEVGPSRVSTPEAEACFRRAVAAARRHSARSHELQAAVSLARLWQKRGSRAEARLLLSEAYGWFTEGFQTAGLQEAKALLQALT